MASSATEPRLGGPCATRLDNVWLVFAVTWAAAVLFHLAGNPRLAPAWGRGILGVAALALLARPRDPRMAVPLAVAVLVNVWLEAPLLANHWLLHGFVAVIVLLGAVRLAPSGHGTMARIAGPLRLLLLAFYVFAAFAKLNEDFFDPAVSCGVFYLQESASSWGLDALVEQWPRWAERGVAVAVAGIELAVPVLLLARRTRSAGVLVALGFHYVLAVDRTHQFFDFSSVLVPLFLLFLHPATLDDLVAGLEGRRDALRRRWSSGPELLRLVALAGVALVVLIASGPGDWPAPPVLRNVGVVLFLVCGAGAFVLVATSLRRSPQTLPELVPAGTAPILLVVPALAVVNGILPYVEVKTAASWNMYSNLAVVDGESNHLLVRAGLPLTDAHARLVEVIESSDGALDSYVGTDWRLPELMLLDHLADKAGVTVDGIVDGEAVRYEGGAAAGRPRWRQKLQVFRAVDGAGPVSCQPSFGPAR